MFLNGFSLAVLLLAPLGALVPTHHHVTRLEKMTDQAAVAQFADAVNQYMNLRWTVEEPREPNDLCSDPAERGAERLARAIRGARATARAGDIFSPTVVPLFRQRITAARYGLRAEFIPGYLEDQELQHLIEWPRLEVNGSLQWNTGDAVSPFLLRTLPPVPPELEYRLVGRDLVLVDVDINLVVDIMENVDGAF